MFVRYYGPLDHRSGYAVAGREFVASVEAVGGRVQSDDVDGFTGPTPPDVVVVHCLPLDIPGVIKAARVRELMPGVPVVAYTTWDGYRTISAQVSAAVDEADAIWVPSRGLVAPFLWKRNLQVIPHAFDENLWQDLPERVHRSPFSSSDPLRFLFVGAWNSRKNPDGLVRAFVRAFAGQSDVLLRIHAFDADKTALGRALATTGVSNPPPMAMSMGWWDDDHVRRLHLEHDVYVSASRGESWDLSMFNAMLARQHIIAPSIGRYDYLEDTSATHYVVQRAPVHGDSETLMLEDGLARVRSTMPHGLTVQDDWLDPDLGDLADIMRSVYARRAPPLRVPYDPRARYGRRAVGLQIMEAIQSLKSRLETKKG